MCEVLEVGVSLYVPEEAKRLVWLEGSEGAECKGMQLEKGRSVRCVCGGAHLGSWKALAKRF